MGKNQQIKELKLQGYSEDHSGNRKLEGCTRVGLKNTLLKDNSYFKNVIQKLIDSWNESMKKHVSVAEKK